MMKQFWSPISAMSAAMLMLFTGCVTGPDYKAPDTTMPSRWSEPLEGGEKADGRVPVQWWTAFSDPTLDALVTQVIEANFDLRVAETRIQEARASLAMTEADLWPQVNTSGSYSRMQGAKAATSKTPSAQGSASFSQNGLAGVTANISPLGAGGPGVTVIPDLTGGGNTTVGVSASTRSASPNRQNDLYRAGFDASWELDIFGGNRRATEASKAQLDAVLENQRTILVSLVAETAVNYFNLRETQQRLDIAQEDLRILKDSLDLAQSRFDAGLTNELDVKTAEAELAMTRASVPQLETAIRRTIHRLGVLSGSDPSSLQETLTPVAPLPPAPPEVLVGMPSELLRRRPDIRSAERNLAAATARIGVATADLFPRFSLTGAFTGSSDKFTGLNLGDNRTWSFGPGISWPVFDAGRIRANIRVQNARQEEALITYEKAVMTSLEEVENALVAYAKEQNRLASLEEALAANRSALDIANELYAQGLVDFLNVLNAQRSLFAAEGQRVQSQAAILTGVASIYKAIGGGWEPEACVTENEGATS